MSPVIEPLLVTASELTVKSGAVVKRTAVPEAAEMLPPLPTVRLLAKPLSKWTPEPWSPEPPATVPLTVTDMLPGVKGASLWAKMPIEPLPLAVRLPACVTVTVPLLPEL